MCLVVHVCVYGDISLHTVIGGACCAHVCMYVYMVHLCTQVCLVVHVCLYGAYKCICTLVMHGGAHAFQVIFTFQVHFHVIFTWSDAF